MCDSFTLSDTGNEIFVFIIEQNGYYMLWLNKPQIMQLLNKYYIISYVIILRIILVPIFFKYPITEYLKTLSQSSINN